MRFEAPFFTPSDQRQRSALFDESVGPVIKDLSKPAIQQGIGDASGMLLDLAHRLVLPNVRDGKQVMPKGQQQGIAFIPYFTGQAIVTDDANTYAISDWQQQYLQQYMPGDKAEEVTNYTNQYFNSVGNVLFTKDWTRINHAAIVVSKHVDVNLNAVQDSAKLILGAEPHYVSMKPVLGMNRMMDARYLKPILMHELVHVKQHLEAAVEPEASFDHPDTYTIRELEAYHLAAQYERALVGTNDRQFRKANQPDMNRLVDDVREEFVQDRNFPFAPTDAVVNAVRQRLGFSIRPGILTTEVG